MSHMLDINFVAQNTYTYKRVTFYGALLVMLCLCATTYFIQQYLHADHHLEERKAQLAGLTPTQKTLPVQSNVETASEVEVSFVSDIVAQLSTPWSPLLSAIEQSKTQDIALLSIEPNRKKRQIMLTGQAKNIASTLQYIKQLEQLAPISEVYLLKHSIDQNDPFKPVGFTLLAKWNI
jgi:hypothetical protein